MAQASAVVAAVTPLAFWLSIGWQLAVDVVVFLAMTGSVFEAALMEEKNDREVRSFA